MIYLMNQAKIYKIPFFFKHWGEWVNRKNCEHPVYVTSKTKMVLMEGGEKVYRVGKKYTGNKLFGDVHDGDVYNEMPKFLTGE